MEAAIETARLWEEREFPPAPCDIPAPGKGQRGSSIPVTPEILADMAVQALLDEVDLTPKPGLVDQRGSGAHTDLTRDLMHRSAVSLWPCFRSMARVARQPPPYAALREELGAIGREGEVSMFAATDGCNTHKGAIWALGLLTAGASICHKTQNPFEAATVAGEIARYPDRHAPRLPTNGSKAVKQYGVDGARGEAQTGFPHVIRIGLPALWTARRRGVPEDKARLDALVAIMAELDDTCVLHRGGARALATVKQGALAVLFMGGTGTPRGAATLLDLDKELLSLGVSPGGSGDLLAATLFLDSLATGLNL